jgi:phosphatidylglycerol:prolipoprotein diacylglycerol transferase
MTQIFSTLPISPYSLFRIIAIIFALSFAIIKRKAFGMKLFDTFSVAAFSVFGAIAGAKALYAIGQIIMHGSENAFWTLSNWNGIIRAGGPLYGSVLGIIGMIFLFAKIFDHKAMDILALASIALFGANFFSRMGCLLEGCCYGMQLSSGKQFPYQLTEGILCAFIFLFFVLWEPEKKHKDMIFPLAVILYSVTRFALEFFRGDEDREIWLSLSSSQWIAILLLAATGIYLLLKHRKKMKKEASYQ